jgi:hypothetical protein
VAVFYLVTAVNALHSGTVAPLSGKTTAVQRRDDPGSKYYKFLIARFVLVGGLSALGVLMNVLATRFERIGEANHQK